MAHEKKDVSRHNLKPYNVDPPKSLATLDGKIVEPAITVKLKMQDVLKVHDAQT